MIRVAVSALLLAGCAGKPVTIAVPMPEFVPVPERLLLLHECKALPNGVTNGMLLAEYARCLKAARNYEAQLKEIAELGR